MFHRRARNMPVRAHPWLAGWSSGSPDSLTAERRGMRAQLMIAGSLLYPQRSRIAARGIGARRAHPRPAFARLMANDAAMMPWLPKPAKRTIADIRCGAWRLGQCLCCAYGQGNRPARPTPRSPDRPRGHEPDSDEPLTRYSSQWALVTRRKAQE